MHGTTVKIINFSITLLRAFRFLSESYSPVIFKPKLYDKIVGNVSIT